MKLKTKMILLGSLPLILAVLAIYIIGNVKISKSVKEIIENDLKAVADSQSSAITQYEKNEFVIKDGELWNGDHLNISQCTDMVDQIREDSKIDVTVFYGDTRYLSSVIDEGKRVIGTKAGDAVIKAVLQNGENYFAENVDICGQDYFAYYVPLYDDSSNTPVGMVFAGTPQNTVEQEIQAILNVMLIAAIIFIIIGDLVITFVANKITKRIHFGIDLLNDLSEGNLAFTIDSSLLASKDESGDIGRAIGNLQNKLANVVGEIIKKSEEVRHSSTVLEEEAKECTTAVEQVEGAVMEIADGATMQASDTQQASDDVMQMGNMVKQTNQNVEQLKNNANDMEKMGFTASDTLKELEKVNERAKDSIGVIYEQTNTTNESVSKIGTAVSLITAIAEETNLLSLNASIEAARAGEQGRGFAVVAAQIQKLAEQSNESARQIEEIINLLMEDSQKAVATMEEVKKIMAEQNEMVGKTDAIFKDVLTGIQQAKEDIDRIAHNTETLDESRGSVVDIVQSLSSVAEQNAASTEETSAAVTQVSATVSSMAENASNLQSIAEILEQSVNIFQV